MISVLRKLQWMVPGWTQTHAGCKAHVAAKTNSRRLRPSFVPCAERTPDFMGKIIFILAQSRMKPKKQGATMVHPQPKLLGSLLLYFVGGTIQLNLEESIPERRKSGAIQAWGGGEEN